MKYDTLCFKFTLNNKQQFKSKPKVNVNESHFNKKLVRIENSGKNNSQNISTTENPDIQTGVKVKHARFGIGEVQNIEEGNMKSW